MGTAVSPYGDTGTVICSNGQYVDEVAFLTADPSKIHVFLNRLNDSVFTRGLLFAPPKRKLLLQDWDIRRTNPVLAGE